MSFVCIPLLAPDVFVASMSFISWILSGHFYCIPASDKFGFHRQFLSCEAHSFFCYCTWHSVAFESIVPGRTGAPHPSGYLYLYPYALQPALRVMTLSGNILTPNFTFTLHKTGNGDMRCFQLFVRIRRVSNDLRP
jgi:hypothetical protein